MFARTCAALAATLVCGSAANAAQLNLTLRPFPDLTLNQLDVRYTSATQALLSSGFVLSYEDDGLAGTAPRQVLNGALSINATINSSGVPTAGTLLVTGSIPSIGINTNQTLLSGNLLQFGFSTTSPAEMQFVFGSLGGALGPTFLGQGPQAAILMHSITGFPGNFGSNWNNLTNNTAGTGTAFGDLGVVPAPVSGALLALGGLFLGRRRRAA